MVRHRGKRDARCVLIVAMVVLGACAHGRYPPDRYEELTPATGLAARGKFQVEIILRGAWHSDGAIIGQRNAARLLAGLDTHSAYTNALRDRFPGVVLPQLTPDPETGLANWSAARIDAAIRSGTRAPTP